MLDAGMKMKYFGIKVRILCLFLVFLGLVYDIHAQRLTSDALKVVGLYKEKRFSHSNSIQLELLGQGNFYSINYERILLNGTLIKSAVNAGIAFYPPVLDLPNFAAPFSINEIVSFGNHHSELGLGCILVFDVFNPAEGNVDLREFNVFYTGRLGYRFQKPAGKYLFRIGFTPILDLSDDRAELIPWGGLSVGYSF